MLAAAALPQSTGSNSFASMFFTAGPDKKPARAISLGEVQLQAHHAKPTTRSISLGGIIANYMTSEESKESGNRLILPPSKGQSNQVEDDTIENGEMMGRTYLEIANARVALGDWKRAIDLWDKALQLQTKRGSTDHAAVAETLTSRGMHLASIGMNFQAVLDLEKAVRIKTIIFDSKPNEALSLELANILVQLSNAQCQLKNYSDSLASLSLALSRREHSLGENTVEVAEIHYYIGRNHHRQRRYSEATKSYDKALDVLRKAGARNDHPIFLRVRRCAADRNILGRLFWEKASASSSSI